MVILDEKVLRMYPPPSYANSVIPPPPFNQRRTYAKLSALPPHLLLQVVYATFPQMITEDSPGVHRKILYWLSIKLRLVNRSFYIACMHVLRSSYLTAYDNLIRSPYSSDPFPLSLPGFAPPFSPSSPNPPPPLRTIQRESQVLDLFIALKVREDVWLDDSELHLEREEAYKDLFDLMQPRSRLEDLVRKYGEREGVVASSHGKSSSGNSTPSSSPQAPPFGATRKGAGFPSHSSSLAVSRQTPPFTPVQFALLSIQFSSRKVGLQLACQGRKRTIVEVARTRDTKLELSAKQLVVELKSWLLS